VIDETDFVCLATMPKAGTHYTHHFLVNYLRRLIGIEGPVLFGKNADREYPNRRYDYMRRGVAYKPTGPLPEGIRDIVVQHAFGLLQEFPGWIITLRRNPLDYIVSQYHYRHAGRVDEEHHVANISAVVDTYARRWTVDDRSLDKLKRTDRKALHLHYEDLVTDPGATFRQMLAFIGQPIDDTLVDETIEAISADKYRAAEQEMLHRTFTVPLARNGSIGQWKNELTREDVAVAREAFGDRGRNLNVVMEQWGMPLDSQYR